MKFTVNKEDILPLLTVAAAVADTKITTPITGNVRLVGVAGQKLSVAATDQMIRLVGYCTADIEESGQTTIPATKLLGYVQLLDNGPIHFIVDDRDWATVKGPGGSRIRVAGLPAEKFPESPAPPQEETALVLKCADLSAMIRAVIFVVERGAGGLMIDSGALLDVADGQAAMVAIGNNRLSVARVPCDTGVSMRAVLSKLALADIRKLADTSETVSIQDTQHHAWFTFSDGTVLACLKQVATIPNYRLVVDVPYAHSVELYRHQILRLANSAMVPLDKADFRSVELSLEDGELVITSDSSGSGEFRGTAKADYHAEPFTVRVGVDGLIGFLANGHSEKVRFSFNDPRRNVMLEPVDDIQHKYVFAPRERK